MAIFKKKKMNTYKLSEDWEFYVTMEDEKQLSIRLDLGVKSFLKHMSTLHTYLLEVTYDEQYDNGFPTKKATQKLHDIEDSLARVWKVDKLYFVGILTGNGKRVFVFMSSEQVKWEKLCKRLMRRYKDILYTTDVILNDQGSYYLANLYPEEEGFHFIENRKICQTMSDQGERFEVARNIDFYAYFDQEIDAKAFYESIQDESFGLSFVDISVIEPKKYQVYFAKEDIPTLENITMITRRLLPLCETYHGVFDSWGTTIEK